ncbi:phenylacetic acid degradation PaaB family protein [Halogeometricum sp. S1BR25-6]|uniref:Phenylacetic acid degradation PaaB family protein n=1 Tax=Halogeometricum salsisoli TaxID=2950536 RepID=A0ABU2GKD7_9EURY|nr:phenylacetic acid degradation PaaB family protein [Halogeometricum sp. S1BR25-6]MDS0300533.1 phenylacetic acid degradation PaaB family protein [Halogeometricum sp. S1BR25-6]
MKYEVFARINAGDELINVGNVDAENDRLAKVYAYRTFDEEDWDRLVVVRREHMVEATNVGTMPDTPGDAA